MKKSILLIAVCLTIFACKKEVKYQSFGKEIQANDAIASKSMSAHYADIIAGESLKIMVFLCLKTLLEKR